MKQKKILKYQFGANIINSTLQDLINYQQIFNQPISQRVANQQWQSGMRGTQSLKNNLVSTGIGAASNYIGNSLDIFGNDTDAGRITGTLFSQGVSSAGNTLATNIMKGQALTEGLSRNAGSSLTGTGAGLASNYIGKGINSLGGDSMLSRGIGQSVATGLGTLGGQTLSNLISGKGVANTLSSSIKAIKAAKGTTDATKLAASAAGKWNLAGLGGQIIGSGLSAAFGPSNEYAGKYGNITQTMDSIYDVAQGVVGMFGPVGMGVSGLMALNKGLSNVFGSTDGMTKTDAILGSAFMPAPVKWLNMWGSSKTGTFNNQSWQNSEKVNSFMGDAFGNLDSRFVQAREEAGKTYGTFSQGAKREAQKNIDYANAAWGKVMAMADQNILQNIKSQDMSSINNQRYAQMIQGGWSPVAVGKQGMKILNNATNHNIGMRLLSGAALIDNKQMILCNVPD